MGFPPPPLKKNFTPIFLAKKMGVILPQKPINAQYQQPKICKIQFLECITRNCLPP